MVKNLLIAIVVAVFMLTACDAPPATPARAESPFVASPDLTALREQVAKLTADAESLRQKRTFDELMANMGKVAYLTPGGDGYSTVAFDLGVLTVQLADVAPYANGCKVVLRLGNVLSATVNGLKATVEWGESDSSGVPKNGNTRSKEVVLSEPLRPGAWNAVPIVLEGVPAEKLGFVRLKGVTHTGIALKQ